MGHAQELQLSIPWALTATAIFLVLNGFFVAAEFALVKLRTARIEALARKGNRSAEAVLQVMKRLDLYLSACQLGITLASLVLGWLAEPAVAGLLLAGAEKLGLEVGDSGPLHVVALALALAAVTVLHMTLGEQAPKIWAIQRAETAAMATALPLRAFTALFRPLIWFINGLSNALLRLAGVEAALDHEGAHSAQELRAMLRSASRAGLISRRQSTLGENVLGLARLKVRHVMVPRVDVAFLSGNQSVEQNLALLRSCGHTRLPLCGDGLDKLLGMVHGKDVLVALLGGQNPPDLAALARPLISVPDTQPLTKLIPALQKAQAHCAAVVDEHGTTVGLVFMEDALEEVVGPLYDEFDQRVERWTRLAPDALELAGSLPAPEAAELLELELEEGEETIAGVVVQALGHIPREGDQVDLPPYRVTVVAMTRRRVMRLKFELLVEGAEA